MTQFQGNGYPLPYNPGARPDSAAGVPLTDASGNAAAASGKRYKPKAVRVYTLALDSARNDVSYPWKGSYFHVIKGYDTSGGARSTTAELSVRLGDRANDAIPMVQGDGIAGVPFDEVFITNTAQSNLTLTVVVIDDAPGDEVTAL